MTPSGSWQLRVAVFLVSFVIIVVEISLMRELALRFWEHLAWLVISIALLGFGASGTLLVLIQSFLKVDRAVLQFISLTGAAVSFPLSLLLVDKFDINLIQMVWQPSNIWKLGALELILGVPFLFGGMFIGLALQDKPEKVPGHYASSFLGSGVGGIMVLPALFLLPPRMLILGSSCVTLAVAMFFARRQINAGGWIISGLLLAVMLWQFPYHSKISEDKDLPQILATPGSKIITQRYGPQGLVEIVEAPAVHTAPGMALNNTEPIPDQLLIILDGQIIGSLYKSSSPDDFAFMKNTTQALPYQLGHYSDVLIGNVVGTEQVGLALFHGAKTLTALTSIGSLAELKAGEIPFSNGQSFRAPDVSHFTATVRGFLRGSDHHYSLIVLPTTDPDLGGLSATKANSLLTLDTFRLCFASLKDTGAISISANVHSPPRESFRLLNMFIDVLKEQGKDPRRHLAMIRNWATITIVVTKNVITDRQADNIRTFSEQRGFDLVWLPDLDPSEVNRHHLLTEPEYYLGAKELLDPQINQFTSNYMYDITSPDDDRPYFHHFSRWWVSKELSMQLGKRSRAYMELGGILLIAVLGQALLLAFTFIVLPLFPAIGLSGTRSQQFIVIGFFSSIGFGFMLLEMGILQRLTLHFGHPIYAASTVLSGFLFFGGLGSMISSRFRNPLSRLHCGLGMSIAVIGSLMLLLHDRSLAVTEGLSLPGRMAVVILFIGPLASLMGMMFPLAIKRLGREQARLVPWAWSANGFASVIATLCAPLFAIQWGFNIVTWIALGCYCLAALLSLRLPS
ncbi:MAG: hypothetical protein ACR2PB_06685 [Desulfocapsaceae bacterium]